MFPRISDGRNRNLHILTARTTLAPARKPFATKVARPPITPPTMAPALDDLRSLSPWWVRTVVDDGDPGHVDVLDGETTEGTGPVPPSRPPEAFATPGSNPSSVSTERVKLHPTPAVSACTGKLDVGYSEV